MSGARDADISRLAPLTQDPFFRAMLSRPRTAFFRACFAGLVSLACATAWAVNAESDSVPQETLAKAKAGDAQAQFELGIFYSNNGSIKNYRPRDADEWLRKAAEQNHLGAMLQLIDLDYAEQGLGWDDSEIARWLERAAALGHTRSASRLGILLWNGGRGLPQDRARAYPLVRTAALRGDETALLLLAERALDGIGVKRDPAVAVQILNFGAKDGILRARQHIKVLPENARRLPYPAEIFNKLEKLADKKDPDALLLLALSQQNDPDYLSQHADDSVESRRAKIRTLLEKAAAVGQPEALARLGIIYANGQGVPVDNDKAVGYFERGAAANNALSQLNLAVLIMDGKAGRADPARVVSLLTAASATNPNAAFELGMIYYEGQLQPRDIGRAQSLFEQAAQSGHEGALINLGVISINGENGTADPVAAQKWWMMAQLGGSKKGDELVKRSAPRLTAEQRADAAHQVHEWQEVRIKARAAQLPELTLD